MATFIQEMAELAEELLASDFLTPATIVRESLGTYDPITGGIEDTTATIECRAVAAATMIKNDSGAIEEVTQIISDRELRSGDVITIGADDYTIDGAKKIAPHGTALVWQGVAK